MIHTKYIYSMYKVCYIPKRVHKVCNEHSARTEHTLSKLCGLVSSTVTVMVIMILCVTSTVRVTGSFPEGGPHSGHLQAGPQ
jgi:hypothetical protein